MELEALRWLVEVADGATVTETAARAHTSQPAVTRALHRLSHEFGAPLTERDGRRLRLTFAGEIAVAAARRALAEIDGAGHAIEEANDPASGTVRLGFLSQLGQQLVPELLSGFRQEHPGVRFTLRQDGTERIMAALLDGRLDLLLSGAPDSRLVSWEPLAEEQLVISLPDTHPLAERERLHFSELRDEQWVLLAPGFGLRSRVDALCQAAGFTPQVAFEGQDLTTLYSLIAGGSGIGMFPSGPTPASVRQLPLTPRQSREVGLIRVPGRIVAPSVGAFADYVRAQLGSR